VEEEVSSILRGSFPVPGRGKGRKVEIPTGSA